MGVYKYTTNRFRIGCLYTRFFGASITFGSPVTAAWRNLASPSGQPNPMTTDLPTGCLITPSLASHERTVPSCQFGKMIAWLFVLAGAYIYCCIYFYYYYYSYSYIYLSFVDDDDDDDDRLLFIHVLRTLASRLLTLFLETAKTASTCALPDTPSAGLMTLCGQSQVYSALEDRSSFKACT